MTPMIEAHGVTKRFGNVDALAGLDLVAESGHVTALLGPNGAGAAMLSVSVAEYDVAVVRPLFGEGTA
jgi:ABC-2 type transport system ATP-binding protein